MFEYFQDFLQFIMDGLYDVAVYILAKLTILFFMITALFLSISWDAAKMIIQELGIGDYVQSLFQQIDSQVLLFLNYLRIPDALNLIMTSTVTRYILNIFK